MLTFTLTKLVEYVLNTSMSDLKISDIDEDESPHYSFGSITSGESGTRLFPRDGLPSHLMRYGGVLGQYDWSHSPDPLRNNNTSQKPKHGEKDEQGKGDQSSAELNLPEPLTTGMMAMPSKVQRRRTRSIKCEHLGCHDDFSRRQEMEDHMETKHGRAVAEPAIVYNHESTWMGKQMKRVERQYEGPPVSAMENPADQSHGGSHPFIKSESTEEDPPLKIEDTGEDNCGKSTGKIDASSSRVKTEVVHSARLPEVGFLNRRGSGAQAANADYPSESDDETAEELADDSMVDSVFGTGSWIQQDQTNIPAMKIEGLDGVAVEERVYGGPTNKFNDEWQITPRRCPQGSKNATQGSARNNRPTFDGSSPQHPGSSSPNDGHKSHKRSAGNGDGSDDEKEIDPTKKQKRDHSLENRFACPFFKHDPWTYRANHTHGRTYASCAAWPGFENISRVK